MNRIVVISPIQLVIMIQRMKVKKRQNQNLQNSEHSEILVVPAKQCRSIKLRG